MGAAAVKTARSHHDHHTQTTQEPTLNQPSPHYQDLRGDAASSGVRLDIAIAECFALSRRRTRRAIDEGGVYLNGKRCRTAGRKVTRGDRLRVVLLDHEQLTPFQPEQLIWQAPPLYLIHKRSGQYAQEALHRSVGTLPLEIANHLQLPASESLRPVHRLDRDTSGLMLLSSDPQQLQQLQQHWQHCVNKRYLAVVSPAPEWQQQIIELPIDKRRDRQGRYHTSPHGRACKTEATCIERRGTRALLRLIPHTGRTHQLRVHLAALGVPILGDIRYGGKAHTRLMLHAEKLRVTPPALAEEIGWTQPPEEDWQW